MERGHDVSSMLTFLQEVLDKNEYVAAIKANHALVSGQSVWKKMALLSY